MNNKLWSFGAVGLLIGLLVGQFIHRNDFVNGQMRACNEVIAPSVAQGIRMTCVISDGIAYVEIVTINGNIAFTLSGKRIK